MPSIVNYYTSKMIIQAKYVTYKGEKFKTSNYCSSHMLECDDHYIYKNLQGKEVQ